MVFVLLIDFVVVGVLTAIAFRKGVETALPACTFFVILIPLESKIQLPGFFDLTTQRLVLVTLAVLYVMLRSNKSYLTWQQTTPLKYLIWAHIVWSSLSTVNSIDFSLSFKRLLSQVFEYYLLYYIFTKTVSHVRTIHRILFAMVAAISICCSFGALEAYTGWSVVQLFPEEFWVRYGEGFGPLVVEFDRGLRVRSTFPHAILFGAAIAITIPLALYLLTVIQSHIQRVFLWLGILLMFWNIYKTDSRGPWLALVISLALWLPIVREMMRKYLLLIGLLTITVLVLRPGVGETIKDAYIATLDPSTPMGASYAYRGTLLQVVTQALAKDPRRQIWGYGMGSFYFLGLEADFQGRRYKFLSCDSAWIDIMVETGYVGLFIVSLLLLNAALMTFKDFRKLAKPDNSLCLVLLISLCAFFFMMTNVEIYSWGQTGHMLWILIAVAMGY